MDMAIPPPISSGNSSKVASQRAANIRLVARDLEELPDFEVAGEGVPQYSRANEMLVVKAKSAGSLLLLTTPEGLANTNTFFEYYNKLRSEHDVQVWHVNSAVLQSAASRLQSIQAEETGDQIANTSARALFVRIIEKGIELKASDVHICIREDTGRVLFRLNGVIRRWEQFSSAALRSAVSVGYTLDAQETTRSQGAFLFNKDQKCMIPYSSMTGGRFNLRYQSEVVVGGMDVSIRYLKNSTDVKVLSFEELGYEESQRRQLRYIQVKAIGATFVAGVTGSGKTTTLNTIIATLPGRSQRRILAYEDPTEYRMRGVSQVSVPARKSEDEDEENPFQSKLKNFLRLDPDTGIIGEIRDRITAMTAAQAVESGHQILSTVHAMSALQIVKRLTSPMIGLTRDILGADDFLTALVYQRLVPKVCKDCAVPAVDVLSESKLKILKENYGMDLSKLRCASAKGCKSCQVDGFSDTVDPEDEDPRLGIKGVTVIAEIVILNDAIREAITNGDDRLAKNLWRSSRTASFTDPDMQGKTCFEHGLYKVSQGLVDIRFVEDAFVEVEFYQPFEITLKDGN